MEPYGPVQACNGIALPSPGTANVVIKSGLEQKKSPPPPFKHTSWQWSQNRETPSTRIRRFVLYKLHSPFLQLRYSQLTLTNNS
jgi:hypothetical protein